MIHTIYSFAIIELFYFGYMFGQSSFLENNLFDTLTRREEWARERKTNKQKVL